MGLVYAEVELINSDDLALARRNMIPDSDVRRLNATVNVDSGAIMLTINDQVRAQLGLSKLGEQVAELADGSHIRVDIVGPVDVRFENRATTVRAMLMPGDTEMLLGAIPMEDMDVIIHPRAQRLIVNPASPILAQKPLK